MSSSTENRSPQSFITAAQHQITVAEKVHPCVTVTEPNWMAMIATQKTQIQLLKEIQDTLPTLTTKEELKAYLDSQLQVLMKYTELTKIATEHFQRTMESSAEELTKSMQTLITDTEKQVGRMNASFSNSLSMLRSTAEDKLKAHTSRMFWISLIPSAVLIILELIQHILSATSAI